MLDAPGLLHGEFDLLLRLGASNRSFEDNVLFPDFFRPISWIGFP